MRTMAKAEKSDKTDKEVVADARMAVAEANKIHAELAKRGITVDWYVGGAANEIVVDYCRVTREAL